jgi:glyoxylase-like metal-dependent hydrolase (beta-lactamase superfamily II)
MDHTGGNREFKKRLSVNLLAADRVYHFKPSPTQIASSYLARFTLTV